METTVRKHFKMLLAIITIVILVIGFFPIRSMADNENVLTPTEYQYLELRAKDVVDVDGQNKQVIMELWAHNLEFKGFQVRFSYNSSKLQPSDMDTNVVTDDSSKYFKFESEFDGKLDFFTLDYSGAGSGIEAIVSLEPPITTSSHIKNRGGNDYYIDSGGELLLGKMSFQMTADMYEDGWFSLVTSDTQAPNTGIKISVTIPTYYEAQSTFKFTDQTASKNANLSNIVVSHGVVDEDDPSQSTYKTYALVPVFDEDTINYEIELMEYIDDVDVTSTLSDGKSTMKIEVPKRDSDGNLVYVGTEIQYEEFTLTDQVPHNVIINKLGEPDTIIKVKVVAEDTVTTKDYTITIKRPCACIHGTVELGNGLRDDIGDNYGVYVKYLIDVTVYNAGEMDWDGIITGDSSLYDLDSLDIQAQVQTDEDDGSFVMYVIPGQYDLIMERTGFLADVTTGITVVAGDDIDLGSRNLIEGDVDRSGIIDLDDIVTLVGVMDSSDGDGTYEEAFDFGQKGFVALDDLVSSVTNCDQLITITAY